jgi:hypothetical protein
MTAFLLWEGREDGSGATKYISVTIPAKIDLHVVAFATAVSLFQYHKNALVGNLYLLE